MPVRRAPRASRIDARFDSVPPVVMKPAPSGSPSSDATMRTASRSSAIVPGCCSAAHSTKYVLRISSSSWCVIGCGVPE